MLCDYSDHCEGTVISFLAAFSLQRRPYVQAMFVAKSFCLCDRLCPINTNTIQSVYSYAFLIESYMLSKFSIPDFILFIYLFALNYCSLSPTVELFYFSNTEAHITVTIFYLNDFSFWCILFILAVYFKCLRPKLYCFN